MGIFGLKHKEAEMKSRYETTRLNQELQAYTKAVEKYTKLAKDAHSAGKKELAQKYAASVVSYQRQIDTKQKEIADLEKIGLHAMSQATEEGRNKKDLKDLVKYANKEGDRLERLDIPYGVELREAANGLSKAEEAHLNSMEGVVGDSYVPQKAEQFLEDIVAEMETEKKAESAVKARVDQAAQAAAAAGSGA